MTEPTTLSVHRCRFVDFTPAAITALAFPPLPLPSARAAGKKASGITWDQAKFGTLAVGRATGNIELCEWTTHPGQVQAPQAWVVRKTLSGPYPSKVDTLVFSLRFPDSVDAASVPALSDLRLFSAGGGSELLEWDTDKGCVQRTLTSQGGSIWSMAVNPASTLLALGCEDGCVRLISLEHDTLAHQRKFDRAKCRLLSIAWGPPVQRQPEAGAGPKQNAEDSDDDDEPEWTDSWIVTGGSDSALRKWDVATGRVLDRMSTDKTRGERTLVWTVATLGDGTIVSGDSLGMVKFWDSRTCTQMHTFQGHGADVLCLAVGPDGTTVYSSGVDQKVTQYSLVQTTTSTPSLLRAPSRWVQATSRRLHSHDVRALASWPPYTALPPLPATTARYTYPLDVAPVLVSGGLDMSAVATPAALPRATVAARARVVNPLATSAAGTFDDAYHRRLAYPAGAAGVPAVKVAREARLVLCAADAAVSVWRIMKKGGTAVDAEEEEDGQEDGERSGAGWEKVLEMDLNVKTNIVSSAISSDGRWLAVSDLYETKLFALQHTNTGAIKPKRVKDFASVLEPHLPSSSRALAGTGASALHFTPDSSKLVLASSISSYLLIVDLGDASSPQPRVLRRFDHHRLRTGLVGDRVVRGRTANGTGTGLAEEEEAEHASPPSSDSESDEEVETTSIGTVSRMAISPDGQWLATTDSRCRTHIFNLDSIQHHYTLPSSPQPVHALAFDPSHPGTLVLGLANNTLQVCDVETRAVPDWARALCASLPVRFTQLHDALLGVAFDPAPAAGPGPAPAPRQAFFWGATWICKVVLDAPVGWGGFSKKRRRGDGKKRAGAPSFHEPTQRADAGAGAVDDKANANFKLITHYRPLLAVDFLGAGELVVFERPLVDVLAKMPPAFWKPKYGAS